ncbi:hypothetical protein PCANC_14138 [Puccinia coronata f. sp. avenae]|uniref:Uncharacterized protein n=1 Tax=Puccinia coronata f. sp. avenae TaxID=200324 RepID=A0A2N5SVR8_9BASI|nr:hypothetical protein PCANC_14138 [Puccinia coronata f. sp. avenae]
MTSTSVDETRHGSVQACFSPRIAVFASQDVQREVCQKNNLPCFVSLLRPFEYIHRVSVRHSNYSTAILNSIRLSFCTLDHSPDPKSDGTDWIDGLLHRSVFTGTNISNWIHFINSRLSPAPSASSAVVPNVRIKRDHEWLGSAADEGEDYPQPPTPWYIRFLNLLFEHRPLVEYDHTSHPLAAMLVVSTSNPDPLTEFSKLHEQTAKDGSGWPSKDWLETGTILRYYLLVHEINQEPDGGKSHANGILDAIKKVYGLNCGLIYINSENTEWLRKKRIVDQDPNFDKPDTTTKKEDYWYRYQCDAATEDQEKVITFGECISEEDILGLKVLLREFTLQSLIPHIERCVQQWNDSLAASRKGITGRLFSVGKKYFSRVPASASSSSTPEHRYNLTTGSYPHQSQEAQTRRLADFSFMLGDYKFASQMYDYLRKDAFNEQAWTYYSSATQMMGLCTLLQSSFSQRSKLDVVDLERFLFDHTVATASASQLRIVMIYYEMARAVGNPTLMSSSLNRVASTYSELISGLIYEQVSRIVSPRQASLYIVLAAHRYTLAQQNWLAHICLRQCAQFVGWDRIEDFIDHKMAQMAELDADWPAALIRYWNVIRRRIRSGRTDDDDDGVDDDDVYVAKFRSLYQKALEVNSSLTLPRIGDLSIFEAERCKIRVPHQKHLEPHADVDPTTWEQLMSRCPGCPNTMSSELNTAVVNEPFYLDLVLRNPLQTGIKVTHIDIQVANSDPTDQADDLSSSLEIAPVDDLELLPLEKREISVRLICRRTCMEFEITTVKFKFDSLIECSQALKKKGKRLQSTLVQRLGRVYTSDESMQVRVRGEVPMLEILPSDDIPSSMYDGESLLSTISIRNSGQVGLKDLQCVISHTSIFRFCSDTHLPAEPAVLYEKSNDTCPDQMVIETPNHILSESPASLAQEVMNGEAVQATIVCRGEEVGTHVTCWLFVFRHATSGEALSFRHVQHLTVLPSITINPVIRPSLTPDAFYLLTLQLNCLDIPEDIEIYQISTISTHWYGKLINADAQSSSLPCLPRGSSSINLAFELHARQDSRDDPATIILLEQLSKLLQKQKLDDSEISKSSVCSHVSLTHPMTEPVVRINSPTLLDTLLSSHRNLRRRALQAYFTSLTMSQIASIFPLTSTRSVDVVMFWQTKGTGRQGHHYVPDLACGATRDLVENTLALVKDKAGGMYQESQIHQRLLVTQFHNSQYGTSSDPVAVHVATCQQFLDWDFEGKGPLTVPVTFTLQNLSTTAAAEYTLELVRGDVQVAPRGGSAVVGTWTNWVGKMRHSGRLERLETRVVACSCWVIGPGMVDIGAWNCRSSYSAPHPSDPLPPHHQHHAEPADDRSTSPVWLKSGSPILVSVADAPPNDPPPQTPTSHIEP